MKSLKRFWGKIKNRCKKVKVTDILTLIIWTYLIFKFKFIRDFILGIFKVLGFIWVSAIVFILAMMVLLVVLFIASIIGVKFGIIDKDSVNINFGFKK